MALPIPRTLEDLGAEWLTDALRSRGVIGPESVISGRSVEELGAGEGFSGELARIRLVYGSGSGPATVVAKIPTSIEDNRNGSERLGVYEREVRVYEDLLTGLDVPSPRLYYADIETHPRAARIVDRVDRIDRWPIWLLRLLLKVLERVTPPRFPSVLLLEDLEPAAPGDQVAGCDLHRAGRSLETIAGLHAATWADRAPPTGHWLVAFPFGSRLLQAGVRNARHRFLANHGHRLSPHFRAVLDRAEREAPARSARLAASAPPCLLHGDFRLDNLFFTPEGNVRALIDWQLTSIGPAVTEVAYFLCGSLAPEVSEEEVDALLARYHAALVAGGVRDYPWEQMLADYDEALLLLVGRMSTLELIDFGDDRGLELVDVWLRRLDARVRRIPT